MTPAQVRHAYRIDQISFSTAAGDGTGQTIAIVDAYDAPTIKSDLATFDSRYSLAAPPSFTVVNQTGGTRLPAKDASGGWELETSLDVEWAHAVAPNASILLVEANSNSNSDLLAAVDYAAAHANVVSMSWGGGEFGSEISTTFENHFNRPGVTFVASSGDYGAPVSWPAISPNVVSVGGTRLTLDANNNWNTETGWSGSGGGTSAYEPQPAYQKGIVTQSATARANPDVVYNADTSTGFAVYDSTAYMPNYPYSTGAQSGWFKVGGTSAGAPQWAALLAIVDQGRALNGKPALDASDPQEAHNLLYASPTAFHDITGGTSTGSPNYTATAGYDLVTGLGSPFADLVASALVNPAPPTPPATPTGLSATADHTGPITLTWNATPGANGYYLFRKLRSDATFPDTPLLQLGPVTTVQNINVMPGTDYDYAIEATNSAGASALSPTLAAPTTLTPTTAYRDTFASAGSFPGSTWNTTTAGTGASWSQDATAGTVSQTGTASSDMKKAFLKTVSNSTATPFLVQGMVHINTWVSGEGARAGISVFTDPSTGRGYNLVLTGRYSNTGIAVGGATTGTIVNPHVNFLDDLVRWGDADLTLPADLTFQAGPAAPWYGFAMMVKNGVLYGAVWQVVTGTATDMPATWMGSQAGWTDHTSGAAGLNGGSGTTFNGVTSYSTASFKNFSVVS